MNKKQAAIIVTLLALIVCAGILATKASTDNPFYVNTGDMGKNASSVTNSDKTAISTFSELRLVREKNESSVILGLRSIVDDKNTPTDGKNDATKKMTSITTAKHFEARIEEQLKVGGFGDVFCYIDDTKAKVIVSSKEKLTDKQTKQINSVVMDVAKIRQVTIEVKQ